MIFCMKVPYYKSKKRAQRFFRKKSGSLIIHENVSIFRPKMRVKMGFSHFLEFGTLHQHQNAYKDIAKRFPTFDNGFRSFVIN